MRVSTKFCKFSWLCVLAIQFSSTSSHAENVVTTACGIVAQQTCGDCELDTVALRKAIATLKHESSNRSNRTADVLHADLCALKGLRSLSAVHLTQRGANAPSDERAQLETAIKAEQLRLLKQHPKNKEVLEAVVSVGALPDDLAFQAYATLSELDKSNAESLFWAGFYALIVHDKSWTIRISASMKRVTNAQLFRQFVEVLFDVVRERQCGDNSLRVVRNLRDNVQLAWTGVEADIELMTPKMLKLSAKFADDVLALRCESTKPQK